jgi:hypothetical protein
LAIVLDRMTQSLGQSDKDSSQTRFLSKAIVKLKGLMQIGGANSSSL